MPSQFKHDDNFQKAIFISFLNKYSNIIRFLKAFDPCVDLVSMTADYTNRKKGKCDERLYSYEKSHEANIKLISQPEYKVHPSKKINMPL